MTWWQASAVFNGLIALCYFAITWNILRGLRDTGQMRTNSLALATAGIFFTCAVHHGSHTVHMLLPIVGIETHDGLAMRTAFGAHMALWDLVGAGVAAYYLTLRRSYVRLLASPQMFEDRVREEAERGLRIQAFTDVLTGLPNRAAFMGRIQEIAQANDGIPSVLFIDLDRFKLVNDTLGHSTGDALLVAVADRLSATLQNGEELFRLGGDEFTVLCSMSAPESSAPLSDRLLAALAVPFDIDGHELYTGASIGAAHASHISELEDLLRRADTAMYHAKDAGGGVAMLFDISMSDKGSRLALSNDLTRALMQEQFHLEYQAIVDLHTGVTVGAEALLRWDHPSRGALEPDDFILFAEETGQIVSIGRWVLQHACMDAAAWQALDDAPYLTINVSAIEILREDFVGGLESTLRSSGLPGAQLWLEVTERTAAKDFSKLAARLSEIERLGVRIALDDFGSGWSSLSHLHRLPIKMIKIDRVFVQGEAGSAAATLVRTVAMLGQTLGVMSVAEGVETEAQLQRLAELGCDLGQGFLLGKPTDADSFKASLAAARRSSLPRQVERHLGRVHQWETQ